MAKVSVNGGSQLASENTSTNPVYLPVVTGRQKPEGGR